MKKIIEIDIKKLESDVTLSVLSTLKLVPNGVAVASVLRVFVEYFESQGEDAQHIMLGVINGECMMPFARMYPKRFMGKDKCTH
jgi:hypothetical protein